jgi:CBS domain-containing protein
MSLAERLAAPGARPLPVLERDVCELMTPGVTSIVESSSLARVFEAFAAHRVHALLVTGATSGRPLGWVTARGLLAWVGRDVLMLRARDAITERAVAVPPGASGQEALTKLLQEGVSHLLVQERQDLTPEGVVSELDLVVNTPR